MPRKKDIWLILAVLLAALVIFLLAKQMPQKTIAGRTADVTMAPDAIEIVDSTEKPDVPVPAVTEESPKTAEPAETTPEVQAASTMAPEPAETVTAAAMGPVMGPVLEQSQEPVKGHVIIMVQGRQYGDPIPMDRDKIITVRQDAHTINRVHITRDSVHMESSTCENQDCVGQGMVTLENYGTRILGTYIVCMPNGVTVEMVPVSEPEAGQ